MEDETINELTELADRYNDYVDDINIADNLLSDLMKGINKNINVDFIDADYWDCIRDYSIDKEKGQIYLYWFIPESDPEEIEMRKMAFPFDYYGIVLKFRNIEFHRDKNKKCYAISINSYTTTDSDVKKFIKQQNFEKIDSSTDLSFFSVEYVYLKDGKTAYMRFLKTPIKSFWIVPKLLIAHSNTSKKLLYQLNLSECEIDLKGYFDEFQTKLQAEPKGKDLDKVLKTTGNQMRQVAEDLFKLMVCYYHKEHNINFKSYNDLKLGDLIGPLKDKVFTSEEDRERLNTIRENANKLSHSTGLQCTIKEVLELGIWLKSFINCFYFSIKWKEYLYVPTAEMKPKKPSPEKYLKEALPNLNVADIISSKKSATDGNAYFLIKCSLQRTLNLPFLGEDLICEDGAIRRLSQTQKEQALRVYDRTEAKEIVRAIYEHLKQLCTENELDEESIYFNVSVEAILVKNKNPEHLFTEEEIREVMKNGDNTKNNRLVIDEFGYPQLINDIDDGHLYPVRQEAWGAGENAVGPASDLSQVHECYVTAIHCWLDYLINKISIYGDMSYNEADLEKCIKNIEAIIKPVKK